METIHRAALGRVGFLGDLYDARTDQFCGISLLNGPPSDSALKSIDNPSVRTEFVLSDSMSEKFKKLNVEGELKASFLGGLIKVEGHGRYLSDERKSARVVSSSLLYNVTTKVERMNILDSSLSISLDALNHTTNATHVVVETQWGANAMISLTCSDEDGQSTEEIMGELKATLKVLSISVEGRVRVDHDTKENRKERQINLKVFADVLPSADPVPQTIEEALEYMKIVPRLAQEANSGKGKLLQFTCIPLSIVEKHLKVTNAVDRVLKQLDEAAIARVVQLVDKLTETKQQLTDLYEDVVKSGFCLKGEKIEEVENFASQVSVTEAKLRTELAVTLKEIRSGEAAAENLEALIDKYQSSDHSPSKIQLFVDNHLNIVEKIQFVNDLKVEDVLYVGKGTSIDDARRKLGSGDCYVLFFSHETDTEELGENKHYFYSLAKEANAKSKTSSTQEAKQASFMAVDLDVRPELAAQEGVAEGVRICLFSNGKYTNEDVLQQVKLQRSISKARTTVPKKMVLQLPNKRVEVKLICANAITGQCPKEKCRWRCEKCDKVIEYGFDQMFYCACGQAPIEAYTFRCGSEKHGDTYVAFDGETIKQLVSQLRVSKEMVILLLGETGVGKSTFINGIVNYLLFDTLEEAEAAPQEYLIPTSFTLTDENFEERLISIGECENEKSSTDGQSATQGPSSYRFEARDFAVRIIDTPGVADTRGTDIDKQNFDKIIRYISNFDELHGICILLKPNESRLTVMFRFCIQELLTHLHRSAANNIVFCFTNARGTLYRPGDTLTPLKTLLKKFKEEQGVEIAISEHTMYCFDNEAFRFLCAIRNNFKFKEKQKASFAESWENSAAETRRLFEHIGALRPHKSSDTVSLNHIRSIIVNLTKPMAEMSTNIENNIAARNQQLERLQAFDKRGHDLQKDLMVDHIELIAKPLPYPKTVCCSSSCTEVRAVRGAQASQTIYKTICHARCYVSNVTPERFPDPRLKDCQALRGNISRCDVCKCSWDKHMHTMFDQEQRSNKIMDPEIQKLINQNANEKDLAEKARQLSEKEIDVLKGEQATIARISAQFGSFLKSNSIIPYNDAYDAYLQFRIDQQKGVVDVGGNRALLESLELSKKMYLEQVKVLNDAMKDHTVNLTVDDVQKLIRELFSLPRKGDELKAILEVANKANAECIRVDDGQHQRRVVVLPSPSPQSDPRFDGQRKKQEKKKWNWKFWE